MPSDIFSDSFNEISFACLELKLTYNGKAEALKPLSCFSMEKEATIFEKVENLIYPMRTR